jgi:AraC-like DNA-binding protein
MLDPQVQRDSVAALQSPGARSIAVPPVLRAIVAHAFVVESEGLHVAWTIPDGTVDLVVADGDVSGAFVAGPALAAKKHAVSGRFRLAGVSLRPGAGALLGAPVGTLTPAVWLPLEDVLGQKARSLAGDASIASVARLFRFVADRAHALADEPRVLRAVELLEARGGRIPIGALARASAASERTLLRLFHERVGLTPKELARILRFQRALAFLRAGRPLVRVAFDAGYADQAHLARELRELAGAPGSRLPRLNGTEAQSSTGSPKCSA